MGDQQKRLYLGSQPKRVPHGAPLCRECNCLNFSNSDLCQKCHQHLQATNTNGNSAHGGNANATNGFGRSSHMTPQGVLRLRNPILQSQSRASGEGQRPQPPAATTTNANVQVHGTTRLLDQPRPSPHNHESSSSTTNGSHRVNHWNQGANNTSSQPVRPSATNSGFVVPGRSFGPAVYGGIAPHISTSGSNSSRATATTPPPRVAGSAAAVVPARAPSPANRPTKPPSTGNISTSSSSNSTSTTNSSSSPALAAPVAAVASASASTAPAPRKSESSSTIGGKRVRVETVTLTREVIDLISSDEEESEADHNRNEAERARHELAVSRFALRIAAEDQTEDEEKTKDHDASTELKEPKNEEDERNKKQNRSQESEEENDSDERIPKMPIQSRCFDEVVFEVNDFPTSDVVAQEMKRARRMQPPSASPALSTAMAVPVVPVVAVSDVEEPVIVPDTRPEPPKPTDMAPPPASAIPAAVSVVATPAPAAVLRGEKAASLPVRLLQPPLAIPPPPAAAVLGPVQSLENAARVPAAVPPPQRAAPSPASPLVSAPIQIPAREPTLVPVEASVQAPPAPASLVTSSPTPTPSLLPPVPVAPAAAASVALPPPVPTAATTNPTPSVPATSPAPTTTESSSESRIETTPNPSARASAPPCIVVDDSDDEDQGRSKSLVRDRILFQSRVFEDVDFDTKDFSSHSESLNLARRSGPVATAPTPVPEPSPHPVGAESAQQASDPSSVVPLAASSTPNLAPAIVARDGDTSDPANTTSSSATTVLQPRKKTTNESTAVTAVPVHVHDRPLAFPVPPPAASIQSPLIKREKVATPRTARISKPSLGYCGPDFLQFMRECVDGDEEIDADDEEELARVKLLEVVDLTHFSDESGEEEEDEEGDFFEIVEKGSGVVPLASRLAVGESVDTALNGQASGGAPLALNSNPEVVAKIKRASAPRPKEPCMICEEKAWIKSLVHCSECKKYYHKRCAREYGDETICWNCDMEGMIDDSEVTEDHDQVLGMLKSLHASPDYDTEAGGEEEEEMDADDNGGDDEKHDDSVAPRPTSSSSSQVLSTLKKQTTRSMKMWKAFQEVGTETIKQEFEETTNRITQELQDEANRAKYTKSFATKEIVEQAMDEVVDHYANLQDREERLQREERVRSPPSSAMASPESVETSSSNAADSSIATGSSGATPQTEPPPTPPVHATTTDAAAAVTSILRGVYPMDPSKPSQSS